MPKETMPKFKIGDTVPCQRPDCPKEFTMTHGKQKFCEEHRGPVVGPSKAKKPKKKTTGPNMSRNVHRSTSTPPRVEVGVTAPNNRDAMVLELLVAFNIVPQSKVNKMKELVGELTS